MLKRKCTAPACKNHMRLRCVRTCVPIAAPQMHPIFWGERGGTALQPRPPGVFEPRRALRRVAALVLPAPTSASLRGRPCRPWRHFEGCVPAWKQQAAARGPAPCATRDGGTARRAILQNKKKHTLFWWPCRPAPGGAALGDAPLDAPLHMWGQEVALNGMASMIMCHWMERVRWRRGASFTRIHTTSTPYLT